MPGLPDSPKSAIISAMNRERIALAVIVLFSAVCMAQRKPVEKWTDFQSWTKLRSGMSKTQVTMLLGQPKETTASQTDSTNIWYYQQIPPEQTNKLCNGCVVFKKNRTGTYTLYRWQDPNWKQVQDDKIKRKAELEEAAQKTELEKQVTITQRKLEQAERPKKTLELKVQQQEEARRMKLKMVAEFEAMEKAQQEGEEEEEEEEEERTAAHGGFLDRLCGIAAGYYFVLVGIILLAIAFAIVLISKSAPGRFWWKHKKKPQKHAALRAKYRRQKYGIEEN